MGYSKQLKQQNLDNIIASYHEEVALQQWYERFFGNARLMGFSVKTDILGDKNWMYLKHNNISNINISFTYNRKTKTITWIAYQGTYVPDANLTLETFIERTKAYIRRELTKNLQSLDKIVL